MKIKYFFLLLLIFSLDVVSAQTYVRGYTKKDGTYVEPHYRSSPNGTKSDNYSTKGNYNPYTGKPGTKKDDSYYGYTSPNYSTSKSDYSSYMNWDNFSVTEYFVKIELAFGTLDANGNPISYIYKKTKTPQVGTYQVTLSDADGDLFEIKGSDIYIKFRGFHGFAGYEEEGVLDIQSEYFGIYYKKP